MKVSNAYNLVSKYSNISKVGVEIEYLLKVVNGVQQDPILSGIKAVRSITFKDGTVMHLD